jgi:hypothetical protein
LPGNPYDGHTLATVLPAIEETISLITVLGDQRAAEAFVSLIS